MASSLSAPAAVPFASATEHLLAELERIDLLIQANVNNARRRQEDDEFRGLYISEQEINDLLSRPAGLPRWANQTADDSGTRVHEVCASRSAEISERAAEGVRREVWLPLLELERRFQLTRFDMDAILICLAWEVDTRYERLYAYLQDDVTRKRPSVDLITTLLCPDFQRKLEARSRFDPAAPLLLNHIVLLVEDASQARYPLAYRGVQLDDRIAAFILNQENADGHDSFDGRVPDFLKVVKTSRRIAELVFPETLRARLLSLAEVARSNPRMTIYLQGPSGVGKQSAAEALCGELGLHLLAADLDAAAATGTAADLRGWLQFVRREATLRGAGLYFSGFDTLLREEQRAARGAFMEELQQQGSLVVMGGESLWEPGEWSPGGIFVRVEIGFPDFAERLALWNAACDSVFEGGGVPENIPKEWLGEIARKFRLSGGQIRNAAATARQLALSSRPDDPRPGLADFQEACRLHSNRKLASLSRRIVPRYRWQDIVLPSERIAQLREICAALEHRPTVHGDWGFDEKLSLGKGLNVLFTGPSGTGKTMAAEVLAGELGLELYKTDLSSIVSKYIGETEKNLARIFFEAASSNAILFFDEADALFGKRSEVRDSHDRYANIEVNFLLQEMERYEGMAILATNLRKNMDEAFVRRMHFLVEFPLPTAEDRLRIWRGAFPQNTPRASDLDLEFLAGSFEMTGGNLKNIALSAAFLAASEGGVVTMNQLIRATRREYQKMGKVLSGDEFGKYAGMAGM